MNKTLILIPTYNELDNASEMLNQLLALNLNADILFLDDNSPDGTGELLDSLAKCEERVQVIHRVGKLGIGSAHVEGIAWAYDRSYERLVTMDCDFTHSPSDIKRLLSHSDSFDVVVGSRYLQKDSLPGWNLLRRFLTNFGHFLTRSLLRMPEDATGAFRVYNLKRIPHDLFRNVRSAGYSFFFESLFLLRQNGFNIHEVPIVLPARTYGHSKMSAYEALRSAARVLKLFLATLIDPGQFRIVESFTEIDPHLNDPQKWDQYWNHESTASHLYGVIATLYRNLIIKRRLNQFIRENFSKGAQLLHAGCGSGQVDLDIQNEMEITAVDISVEALQLYKKTNPRVHTLRHADILKLPFAQQTFDGAYNLGVLEHFTDEQIRSILSEIHRVLKVGGRVVIFWPHAKASSVRFLKAVHWILNKLLKQNLQLHPPEISLLRSQGAVESLFRATGFELLDFYFGVKDFFVQAVVIGQKRSNVIACQKTADV